MGATSAKIFPSPTANSTSTKFSSTGHKLTFMIDAARFGLPFDQLRKGQKKTISGRAFIAASKDFFMPYCVLSS